VLPGTDTVPLGSSTSRVLFSSTFAALAAVTCNGCPKTFRVTLPRIADELLLLPSIVSESKVVKAVCTASSAAFSASSTALFTSSANTSSGLRVLAEVVCDVVEAEVLVVPASVVAS